jgi:hypothetical protein
MKLIKAIAVETPYMAMRINESLRSPEIAAVQLSRWWIVKKLDQRSIPRKEANIKAISTIMMELDTFTSKSPFTSRTAKLYPCSINKPVFTVANAIEIDWYRAKAVGQTGDHGTNSSNTHDTVELEVEFMVLLECSSKGEDTCYSCILILHIGRL